MRLVSIVTALLLLGVFSACVQGRKSPAGLHFPDGNVEAGKAAFVELKCGACHKMAGLDLHEPIADPPVGVVLGGEIPRERTDGELITAIVNPSHDFAHGFRPEKETSGGTRSRMGDFGQAMTVRQLIDVVAFLHAQYKVVPPPPMVH